LVGKKFLNGTEVDHERRESSVTVRVEIIRFKEPNGAVTVWAELYGRC